MAVQRLAKDCFSCDLTIYTDGSAMNCTAIGGGGILVTDGHQSNPTIHHSYATLTGTRCSSFQAEMKAIKKALQIIQTERSPQKVRIMSDSQSVLLRIANLQPAIPFKSADESDILSLLAALHDEGHQITFTCCPSHCGVVGNEMADEQAQKGAAANQEDVHHNYDCDGHHQACYLRGEISHEGIHRVYGMTGEKLDLREESKLSRKEQMTMVRLISGHHQELKYWLHKIGRTVDTVCGKCGIGEETSEHVVYGCP